MIKQERYHEWIKKQFEKTREDNGTHALGSDRRNTLGYDLAVGWKEKEQREDIVKRLKTF